MIMLLRKLKFNTPFRRLRLLYYRYRFKIFLFVVYFLAFGHDYMNVDEITIIVEEFNPVDWFFPEFQQFFFEFTSYNFRQNLEVFDLFFFSDVSDSPVLEHFDDVILTWFPVDVLISEFVFFQDPATSDMFFIVACHDYLMFFLFIILSIIAVLVINILSGMTPIFISSKTDDTGFIFFPLNRFSNRIQLLTDAKILEVFWTEYPSLLVIFLVIPILIFMFGFQEVDTNAWELLIHVIGQQWFWTYEYVYLVKTAFTSDLGFQEFFHTVESRLVEQPGSLRLLSVDNALVLPINLPIHLFVTGYDVIHSWSVPALGIKVDAVPGRINHVFFSLPQPGRFVGQCSELCGVQHGFMPIVVDAVPTIVN